MEKPVPVYITNSDIDTARGIGRALVTEGRAG